MAKNHVLLVKSVGFFILSLLTTAVVNASNVNISLNGDLNKPASQNIMAHLGPLPQNTLERSAFIYSINDKTNTALQALGYYKADINVQVIKHINEPWQVTLLVKTNTPTLIDNVDITLTGEALNDQAFTKFLKENEFIAGEQLNHGKYEQVKTGLLSLAIQRGFFDAKFKKSRVIIDKNYQTAHIKLHLISGPRYQFGEISFSAFPIQPELLTRFIPFSKGSPYTTSKFHQLQQELKASNYFSEVITTREALMSDEVKKTYKQPISVTLKRAKRHKFNVGIGYATDTKFRVSASWRTPLINQYGHFQETKLEYSKINPTGKFVYSVPLSHPKNDLLQAQLQVENDQYSDLETKFYSAQIARVVNKNTWQRQVYVRFHKEAWRYELAKGEVNSEWTDDTADYLIPGFSWSKTTRQGNPIDPSQGFRQTYKVEGAHLDAGSDNSFFRIHGHWTYIHSLTTHQRLVTRAEFGAIYVDRDAELAPSLRFYAGGDESIRGFAYQSIGKTVKPIPSEQNEILDNELIVGGTRLIVASIEYQYYFADKWRMSLFSDGGSVADKGEFEPVYSLGTGIHYLSPIGAIKFELAHGVDDNNSQWRLHFNLGAEL